jgi:hypothetical protein
MLKIIRCFVPPSKQIDPPFLGKFKWKGQYKNKVIYIHAMEAYKGSGGIIPLILIFGTR